MCIHEKLFSTYYSFQFQVDPKWTPGTKLDIHFKWMHDVTGDGVPDVSCVPKIKAQQITVPAGIPPGQLMQLQNPNTKNMYSIQCPMNCGPGSVLEVEYLDSDGDGRYNYTGKLIFRCLIAWDLSNYVYLQLLYDCP